MVMEFLLIKMETDTKDNFKMPWSMAKEYKDLSMVIFTKDFLKMISHMDMESIIGKIKAISKEIFQMD